MDGANRSNRGHGKYRANGLDRMDGANRSNRGHRKYGANRVDWLDWSRSNWNDR